MKGLLMHWRSRWAAFVHDFLSIPIAWFGAYWLRFNLSEIPPEILSHAVYMLPWVLGFQTVAFWIFGLYRGVWRFASMPDLTRIIKAIMMGCLMTLLALFLVTRLQYLPRSVIPTFGILLLLLLGGSRFLYRWSKDKQRYSLRGQRVLIVGAGRAGESLVRDLLRSVKNEFIPVAFVDDQPRKQGLELHGIRVMGTCNAIPEIVRQYDIGMILIALPSAKASAMRRIAKLCESTGKPVRTLPAMNDLVSGLVSVKNLREIALVDLLGRDPVKIDWASINKVICGKVVFVSGGGGSIGSELCRQVLSLHPKHLVVVDNSEYNLFSIQSELLERGNEGTTMGFHLLDINDEIGLNQLLTKVKPHVIFHAAAYKHVPLLEPQIRTAVQNNVLGTHTLAKCAVAHSVQHFVLVSTDKAVNPTNVMGATKRVAELTCQHFNGQGVTHFTTVRFGNVLGSRGSVVETFQRQLEKGGPITVTHPEVVRYFMTIQEASQLILQALSMGEGGELFVLDMGEPVKIRYMAEQMIHLAGKTLGEDITIEYVGLRPGEKLFEELFHNREQNARTSHNKILKAEHRDIEEEKFQRDIDALYQAVNHCDDHTLYQVVKKLVPELSHPRFKEPQSSRDEVVLEY